MKSLARACKLARIAWTLARAAGPRALARLARGLDGALVQVENTSHCNFRCRYCPTHSPDSTIPPRRAHMALETFRAILAAEARASLVLVQGQGEPLLDPGFFEKIAAARARGKATQVITNGSLLREPMIARLCREGPDVLLVSVDAASPAKNEADRAGMRYAEVARGLGALVRARDGGPRRMVVGVLSIVAGPFDAAAERALRSFDALGIDVLLYKQLNASYEDRIRGYRAAPAGRVPRRVLRALGYPVRHQRIATIRPCAQLRHDFPYFLASGARTPCCVLNDERYAAPAFARPRLLAGWRAGRLPAECERCSYFGGYGRGAPRRGRSLRRCT
jgi:hypothetical protein